ncbi:hypothetical protein ACFST9_07730 [Hymenobacter monticola]|uniref:Uncharacterized protein n=1 Tax=Hymenobacter monticola TaxID=1705399 RepID=A0ABY4B7K5_9BACT|nr:hypothetical protein [Hymenobacter monticola]UOE33748.1 hypothetical protein MTP16_21830 [Hymenobacter monticola]
MGIFIAGGLYILFWTIIPLLLASLMVNLPLCLLGAPLFFSRKRLLHGGNAWVRSLVIVPLIASPLIVGTQGGIIFNSYGSISFFTVCLLSSVSGLLVEKAKAARA